MSSIVGCLRSGLITRPANPACEIPDPPDGATPVTLLAYLLILVLTVWLVVHWALGGDLTSLVAEEWWNDNLGILVAAFVLRAVIVAVVIVSPARSSTG